MADDLVGNMPEAKPKPQKTSIVYLDLPVPEQKTGYSVMPAPGNNNDFAVPAATHSVLLEAKLTQQSKSAPKNDEQPPGPTPGA